MKRFMTACAVLALAVSTAFAGEPPTTQQILEAAWQAAQEDDSRESLAEVAAYFLPHDRERALGAALSAADAQPRHSRSVGEMWAADRQIAATLTALGHEERARAVLRSALSDALTVYGVPRGWDGGQRALAVSEMALRLWPEDEELVRRAAETVGRWLELLRPDYHTSMAVPIHQTLLAAIAPQSDGGADGPTKGTASLLKLVEEDPLGVLNNIGAICGGGQPYREPFEGAWEVRHALVATLLRMDAAKAMAAASFEGPSVFSGVSSVEGRNLIADAALDAGVGDLPMDPAWDSNYARLCGSIARCDHDAANALALRLTSLTGRAEAFRSMTYALVDAGQIDRALDVGRRLRDLCRSTPGIETRWMSGVIALLAPHDALLAGELTVLLSGGAYREKNWLDLWRQNEDAAIAALDGMAPASALSLFASTIEPMVAAGQRDAALARADEVLTSPHFPEIGVNGASLLEVLAHLDPTLARRAWQSTPAIDPADAGPNRLTAWLKCLFAVADAMERVERGSSGPEAAEIERLMPGVSDNSRRSLQLRGRLAEMLTGLRPERARDVALEVLDARARCSDPYYRDIASRHAIRALSRVDPDAAIAALLNDDELRRDHETAALAVAGACRNDVDAAFEMLDLLREDATRATLLRGAAEEIARDVSPEALRTFVERWTREAPRPGATVAGLLPAMVAARRPELSELIIGLLGDFVSDDNLARVIMTHPSTLALASDELLAYVHDRVGDEKLGRPMTRLIAARVERNWELGQVLLSELPPRRRVEALLAVETVRNCRRDELGL